MRRIARASLILIGFLIITAIAASFLGGKHFRIHDVQFTGNERASEISLHHLSDLHHGKHVFSGNRQEIQADIERHPWVKKALIDFVFPSTVRVYVEEHKPVMLLALDKVWYLSDEHIPFRLADSIDLDYPVLTGIPHDWGENHPEIIRRIFVDANKSLEAFKNAAVTDNDKLSEIHFDKDSGFSIILRNGSKIIFGFYEPKERLERLRQMVDEGLDLEVPKEIVLDHDRVAVVTPLSSIRNE